MPNARSPRTIIAAANVNGVLNGTVRGYGFAREDDPANPFVYAGLGTYQCYVLPEWLADPNTLVFITPYFIPGNFIPNCVSLVKNLSTGMMQIQTLMAPNFVTDANFSIMLVNVRGSGSEATDYTLRQGAF